MKKFKKMFVLSIVGLFMMVGLAGCEEDNSNMNNSQNESNSLSDEIPTESSTINDEIKSVEELFEKVKEYNGKQDIIDSTSNVMMSSKTTLNGVVQEEAIKQYIDLKNVYIEQIDLIDDNDFAFQKVNDEWIGVGGCGIDDSYTASIYGSIYEEAIRSFYIWNYPMETSYQTYNVLTEDFIENLKIESLNDNGTGKLVFNSTEGVDIEIHNSYVPEVTPVIKLYEYNLEFKDYRIIREYIKGDAGYKYANGVEQQVGLITSESLCEYNTNYEAKWLVK